jgi:hypothetical protein
MWDLGKHETDKTKLATNGRQFCFICIQLALEILIFLFNLRFY